MLEHLELVYIFAHPSLFVDLIAARWRAGVRTLMAITLSRCVTREKPSDSRGFSYKALAAFKHGEDPARYPPSWTR